MTSYNNFEENCYSEEIFPVTEEEYEAVMREMAEDQSANEGFEQYLDSLEESEREAAIEQAAFEAEQDKAKAFNWNKPDPKEIRVGGVAI